LKINRFSSEGTCDVLAICVHTVFCSAL
jgi:hypothetical protein